MSVLSCEFVCFPTECEAGSYGYNCDQPCPTNCAGNCSNVNGDCVCMDGWTGPECLDGKMFIPYLT